MGINRDVSLGKKLFLIFPSSSFEVGDYVAFESEFEYGKGLTFVKRIECGPGDRIIRKGREFYCLRYLGKALERTREGKPLKPSDFEGEIPENCYWVKGTHERSYDSRYYGLICEPKLKAVPLY